MKRLMWLLWMVVAAMSLFHLFHCFRVLAAAVDRDIGRPWGPAAVMMVVDLVTLANSVWLLSVFERKKVKR